MKSVKYSVIAVLIFITAVFGAFESDNVSARSTAVANANTAAFLGTVDVRANPAHLPAHEKIGVSATVFPSVRLAEDKSTLMNMGLSTVMPLGKAGAAGLDFIGQFAKADQFALYNEFEIHAAYGLGIGDSIGVGLGLAIQRWNVSEAASGGISGKTAFNLDIGFNYKLKDFLSLGLCARNLLGPMMDISAGDASTAARIPMTISVGAAYLHDKFMVSLDVEPVINSGISVNTDLGGEFYVVDGKLHLGMGLSLINFREGVIPSIGLGLNLESFGADYTFAYPVNIGGAGTHMITLNAYFDSFIK